MFHIVHAFAFMHIDMRLNMALNSGLASSAINSLVNDNSAKGTHDVAQEILRAVEALKQGSGFGSVEVILHEGRVTQIEKREKLRFKQP